jgi:vacuolar protein sorting-associated protein 18
MILSNRYRNETHEVIKYLEFCIKDLRNEDPGVHNLLLSLYAMKVLSF